MNKLEDPVEFCYYSGAYVSMYIRAKQLYVCTLNSVTVVTRQSQVVGFC